ncbi:unnamed protein product [Echinostoma caproni]|uniref:EF-hand domain-containing protein n=1 Tax=Echinostoma caproni TaxID=27848 RepID=A0A183A4U6_9TREM|nr:unnamed protein product [Echinostoma caproni]
MHYKEQFVSKWISLFDPKNEGVITYEGYCRTLGLIPRRHDEEGDERKPQTSGSGPKPGTSSTQPESKKEEEKKPEARAE